MKKSVIICAAACAAYGATLLAIGIYIAQFNLSQLFVQMLVEKTGFLALILSIALYLPILLMRFIPFAFIFYGAAYIFIFARTVYKLYKCDFQWLQKYLFILSITHGCLFVLILFADCIIFPYIFINIQSGVSVPLVVFTLLINTTGIALEISNILAVKKLKQMLLNTQGPSV